jgi:hypothetical protein
MVVNVGTYGKLLFMQRHPMKYEVIKDNEIVVTARSMSKAIELSGIFSGDYMQVTEWQAVPVYPRTWKVQGFKLEETCVVIESGKK